MKTYIRSGRLAASLKRLLSTELRVLDIAMLAGFESQEAFARTFKQAFGLTPQTYQPPDERRLGVPLRDSDRAVKHRKSDRAT